MLAAWIFVIIYFVTDQRNIQSGSSRRPLLKSIALSSSSIPVIKKKKFKLILFGDSVIQKPAESFGLLNEVQRRLPHFDVENSGKNGQHVYQLQQRVYRDVVIKKPDVVFLFWDSDVSATPITTLNTAKFQKEYTRNVSQLILILKNVSYVLVSGPGLLSEGPMFRPGRFRHREPVAEKYVEINRKICNDLNVTYIDMRTPFRESIPLFWLFYRWYVTADGEHGNSRGSVIVANELVAAMADWMAKANYYD